MLLVSLVLGVTETVMSLIFAYGIHRSSIFQGRYIVGTCSTETQAIIWVQMFIAAELLIFSTRAPSFFVVSLAPSLALTCSVLLGCIVVSLMACLSKMFGGLDVRDILLIWAYDIVGLFVLDVMKVMLFRFFQENMETLPDEVETGSVSDKPPRKTSVEGGDIEGGLSPMAAAHIDGDGDEQVTRQSIASQRLSEWAAGRSGRMSSSEVSAQSMSGHSVFSSNSGIAGQNPLGRKSRAHNHSTATYRSARESLQLSNRVSISSASSNAAANDLRPALLLGGSLRPNVPHNKKLV